MICFCLKLSLSHFAEFQSFLLQFCPKSNDNFGAAVVPSLSLLQANSDRLSPINQAIISVSESNDGKRLWTYCLAL